MTPLFGRQRVSLNWYQATTRSILFHTRCFPPVPAASSSAHFSQSRRPVLWLSRIEPSGRAPKGHSILAVPSVLKALLRPSCICRAAELDSLRFSVLVITRRHRGSLGVVNSTLYTLHLNLIFAPISWDYRRRNSSA